MRYRTVLIIALFFISCSVLPGLPLLAAGATPPVKRTLLSNQITVLLSEEHSLPFVTLQLLIDAGSRRDPVGEEGLARLTAKGLLLGTPKHTAPQINEELDFSGIHLDTSAGRDYMTISLRVLKKDIRKGIQLFTEILTQPAFPKEEIDREVKRTIAAIHASEDEPGAVAERAFEKALYRGNPYGHPVEGTKESLPRITDESVRRFYRAYYRPNKAILVIVGNINPDEVGTMVVPYFETWQSSGEVSPPSFEAIQNVEVQTIKIDRSITQANIILGSQGVSRDNPDFYALTVMNYILGGGGFSSRLVEAIRNKRGLAYSVTSFFDPGRHPGSFQIVLQTKNASARETVSLALEEIKKMQQELVSEKELEAARKYLIGSFPMRLDSQGKLARFLGQVEYYGLGLDYPERYPAFIASVTREEILRVAGQYLPRDNYILVVVANIKETGMNETGQEVGK
jgi:zinc protease